MKHLFFKSAFVFLALALLLGMSVSALAEEITIIDSGDCGTGLTYELNSAGVLTVSGNGSLDMVFYEEVPWFPHREMIRQVVIEDGVTSLCNYAFFLCSNLTDIEIPESVTKIGEYAFEGCSSLASISIPASVTDIRFCAFMDCPQLKSVHAASLASWIRITFENYFSNPLCNGASLYLNGEMATSLKIPGTVSSIRKNAFVECRGLTDVIIPDTVQLIGEMAFMGSDLTNITIPESVTKIGNDAFYGCKNLAAITIPSGVTAIRGGTFAGCEKLTSIIIPEGVTEIETLAFSGCTGLTELVIPEKVTTIALEVFSGCTGLTEIRIPESVESIGKYSFYGCDKLERVIFERKSGLTLPSILFSNRPEIHCHRFSEADYWAARNGYDTLYLEHVPTVLTLPASLKAIEAGAFEGATAEEIILPEGTVSIGARAFANCKNLLAVHIPESVSEIAKDAFTGCGNLKIICAENSAAHRYARTYGIACQLK